MASSSAISADEVENVLNHGDLNALSANISTLLASGRRLDIPAAVSVLNALDDIFANVRSASNSNNSTCVGAISDLLVQAIATAPEADVIHSFAQQGHRQWHNFATIIDYLSVRQALGRQACADVLKVLQLVTAMSPLKDMIGDSTMDNLAQLLHDPDGRYGGATQRIVATCIINLVNGSKSNKDRITPLLHHVAAVILSTDDFFLQLQCSEILFRVTRLKPSILQHLTALPPLLRAGFATVPADATMLECIHRLLDQFNRTQSPPRIIAADLVSVGVVKGPKEERNAPQPLCGATMAYFGRKAALVMLPGTTGEHLVVEYTSLLSSAMNSQSQLMFRLRSPPVQLQSRMANGESLCLQLTPGVVQQLKLSPLHDWIAATRNNNATTSAVTPVALPSGRAQWQAGGAAPDASPAQTIAAAPPPPVAPSALDASMPVPRAVSRRAESSTVQYPSATTSVGRGLRQRDDEVNEPVEQQHGIIPPARRQHMTERDSNATAAPTAKGPSMPPPQSHAAAPRGPELKYTASLPRVDFGNAFTTNDPDDVSFAPAFNLSRSVFSTTGHASGAPRGSISSETVDDVLQHVKRQVSDRMDAAQTEAKTILATAKGMVRAKVQAVVEANRKDRDAFDLAAAHALRQLKEEETATRAFIVETFDSISADLGHLRGVADVVDQRIEALSGMIDDVLQQSCAVELEMLREFKTRVDADIATLEDMLMRAASTVNTQDLMQQLLQQQQLATA